jgi:DNA-directed RNA polymerase specialized sigma24 family protein
MHRINPHESYKSALNRVLSAKYPWLLRWALHFAQNDRAAAEDLVQETFIRILGIQGTISDLDDIEPLLYTHLRFAYLTERRRAMNHTLQDLSTIDFDTLAISLRTSTVFDQIEVQNELRKILVFLLWRRRSAKFASIFLLRFFHGFSPLEIASICLITRRAVDLGLLHTRQELKTYLTSPSHLHVLRRGTAPEYKPLNVAVPSRDFENEIVDNIFNSPCGVCPTNTMLERHYQTLNPCPLDCELLAHIVSCKVCLNKVTRLCDVPPPTARSMEDSLKPTRRSVKSKRSEPSEKEILARMFAHREQRMRELFDHRPSGLVIALNAEVVAVRDISSPRAVLRVETRSIKTLDMVEVFSEQGMLMIALPLLRRPPESSPELSQEIALSDDRTLGLIVHFTADGAVIETTYLDPHFTMDTADESIEDMFAISMPEAESAKIGRKAGGSVLSTVEQPLAQSWWLRLYAPISALLRVRPLVPIAAVSVLLACAMLWITENHQREQLRATNLLNESVRAERHHRIAHGPSVVHQRVAIHTAGRTLEYNVYRDIDSRRHPKAQPMDSDEQVLRTKLEEAGLDWDDPLSAAGFQAWHDHQPGNQDQIQRTGSERMTVTTELSSGPVLSESLTIRLNDLHPVGRILRFRDRQTVEVAELSYEVLPWGPESENWFEPIAGSLISIPSHPTALQLPHTPSHLSEADMDIARLNVLLELQNLNASADGLSVTQENNGITVAGIVESDNRKLEISTRLRMIPHVIVNIHSYRDFDSKPETVGSVDTIKAMSVVAGESPLDGYCKDQQVSQERCQQLALLLLNSSAALVRESKHLSDLEHQYPPTKPMTPAASALLSELIHRYIDHLAIAAREEEDAFPVLGVERSHELDASTNDITKMNDIAQHNLLLAKELVYAGDEHSRSALLILHDLARSAEQVRTSVSLIPLPTADHAALSSSTSTPHHD